MKVQSIKTRIFKPKEKLLPFIIDYLPKIKEKTILVITSKIVALAEGRTAPFINKKQKAKLIKQESDFAVKTKYAWLTIKDQTVMASAGIDESNAAGQLILLPENSFKSAEILRIKLARKFRLKNLGILITDSRLTPFRAGIVGGALGYAGFSGLKNYIGKKDIFGRTLKMSKVNLADSLATAAVLCLGEGRERQPLALITDAPVIFTKKINKTELMINPKSDIFYPLLKNICKKIKRP